MPYANHVVSSTERSEASSAERVEALFGAIPAACFTCDRHGVIGEWTRAAQRLLGFADEEAVGQSAYTLLYSAGDRARSAEVTTSVFAGSAPRWTEARLVARSGEIVAVLAGVLAVRSGAGEIVAAAHVLLDPEARGGAEATVREQIQRLEMASAALVALVTTDGLTGLSNHRQLHERLSSELRRALLRGEPTSLLLADVDHFKAFNDTHGHAAGDETLRDLGSLIAASLRPGDSAARYGGEEFAVVLPRTSPGEASTLARRLRDLLRRHEWRYSPVSLSIGVATSDESLLNCGDLVDRADRALYAAKAGGRDRVVDWESLGEPPAASIALEEWVRRIDEARRDPTGTVASTMLQQAIFDHVQWKNRLRLALGGAGTMPFNELSSHRDCRLGRWYFSVGKERFGDAPEYQELAAPHARLHDLASGIQAALYAGRSLEVAEALQELEECSASIVHNLERLIVRAERGGA